MKGMLSYFRTSRILYKNLASEFEKSDPKKSKSYDRKQLPIKIFINSMFGALSAPQVFHWGDMDKGEQITTTGRQYLRMMIKFFMKKGYTALVMDTDGVNFSCPADAEDREYIGKGLNWKVKVGKVYKGCEADVAEFNDIFMRGEMALDTDGTWPACINLARKNYAVMDAKGKIKLTGNTIKSKKMPLYIEVFLDEAIKMLLEGKGQEFIEYYYEYVTKIFEKRIPLLQIASRAKVKLTIDDYIKRSKQTTKAGNLMSRQAHMELAIKESMSVNLGDVIYYVNNGTKASHGDVQKKGDQVILNCYRIDDKELGSNPDMTGEYNVPRAISTFNKRIEPLLVVFGEEVRKGLLVTDPSKREFYTKGQSELINGVPFEDGDQDKLDDVLNLSDDEVKYWERVNMNPEYMYELANEGWVEYV